jgi:hypothetical protein
VKSQISLRETQLLEAITCDITIGKHNEIKPFNAEKLLKETIAYCAVTSGVTKVADMVTAANLREYFFSELKNFTFEEVKRAVYFNSIGEYPERIITYDLFDVSFLSKVMTEWLILKTKTRQRVATLLPKPKESEPETPQSLYQGLLNYINKNQEFPFSWAWEPVFNYMDKEGLIKDTDEEKRTIWKAVKTEFESKLELELMDVKDFIERSKLKEELPERCANEYRKRRIVKNLSYLLEKATN